MRKLENDVPFMAHNFTSKMHKITFSTPMQICVSQNPKFVLINKLLNTFRLNLLFEFYCTCQNWEREREKIYGYELADSNRFCVCKNVFHCVGDVEQFLNENKWACVCIWVELCNTLFPSLSFCFIVHRFRFTLNRW